MNWLQERASKIFRLNLPYSASGLTNIDDVENLGWTALTVGNRDLPQFQQDRMMEIAAYLYKRNAIAHRIVEVIKSFIVGEGIVVRAKDPDVNRVIQRFWTSRRNNWRKYLRERVVSHSIYGEAVMPAYVNEVNGAVILGNAHPIIVKQVLPNIRNTFEAEVLIIKEGKQFDGTPVPEQHMQVIKVNTEVASNAFLRYDGDVFFFAINKPLDNLRGASDLFSIADWLDIYDQFMFNRAERQSYINTFLWDIEIKGANAKEIDTRLQEMILNERKQRSGKFYVHNEKEQRKAIAPEMFSDDAVADSQMFLNMVMGGTGLSVQAFGDPGGRGRQASGDVNEWVFKTLSDRQFIWRDMILEILEFVIDQAEIHNEIDEGKDRFIEVFMPKISMRDMQRMTQSLRNLGGFIGQVSKADSVLVLDDKDKLRLKDVMHTLLDHIDQASGAQMQHTIEDVVTGNKASELDQLSARSMFGSKDNEEHDIKFNTEEYELNNTSIPNYEDLLKSNHNNEIPVNVE